MQEVEPEKNKNIKIEPENNDVGGEEVEMDESEGEPELNLQMDESEGDPELNIADYDNLLRMLAAEEKRCFDLQNQQKLTVKENVVLTKMNMETNELIEIANDEIKDAKAKVEKMEKKIVAIEKKSKEEVAKAEKALKEVEKKRELKKFTANDIGRECISREFGRLRLVKVDTMDLAQNVLRGENIVLKSRNERLQADNDRLRSELRTLLRIVAKPVYRLSNSDKFTLRRQRGHWVSKSALSCDSPMWSEELSPEEARKKAVEDEQDRRARLVEDLAVGRQSIGDDLLYQFPDMETARQAADIINAVYDEVLPELD